VAHRELVANWWELVLGRGRTLGNLAV
jgi:hypothetical protein